MSRIVPQLSRSATLTLMPGSAIEHSSMRNCRFGGDISVADAISPFVIRHCAGGVLRRGIIDVGESDRLPAWRDRSRSQIRVSIWNSVG